MKIRIIALIPRKGPLGDYEFPCILTRMYFQYIIILPQ